MGKTYGKSSIVTCIIVAMVGAFIAIGLFGKPSYRIGAFDVRLAISPSLCGETRVSIPPLGKMIARTHKAPMAIEATVDEASLEDLHSMFVGKAADKAIMGQIKDDAKNAIIKFVLRLIILAFLGGTAAVLLFRVSRRLNYALLGGASAAALILVLMALTALTYNAEAFNKPTLTNTLKSVPWIVKLAKNGVIKIGEADARIRKAATDISSLEKSISGMGSAADLSDQMKILVISDLHNNPMALGFARNLADEIDADMVLDAGDLTDLGSQFESGLIKQFGDFGRPHIFVTGNHDSEGTVAALKGLNDTYVVNERIITIEGIKILGQNDPTTQSHTEKSFGATPRQISKAAKRLNTILRTSSEQPDIIMVHEPYVASRFIGKAPIVISGHDHKLAISSSGRSVWVRPGSTGASGVRYFTEKGGKSMTAVILYVSRPPKVRAVAADMISINSPNGEFTITRKRFK